MYRHVDRMIIGVLVGGFQSRQPQHGVRIAPDTGRHLFDQTTHTRQIDISAGINGLLNGTQRLVDVLDDRRRVGNFVFQPARAGGRLNTNAPSRAQIPAFT